MASCASSSLAFSSSAAVCGCPSTPWRRAASCCRSCSHGGELLLGAAELLRRAPVVEADAERRQREDGGERQRPAIAAHRPQRHCRRRCTSRPWHSGRRTSARAGEAGPARRRRPRSTDRCRRAWRRREDRARRAGSPPASVPARPVARRPAAPRAPSRRRPAARAGARASAARRARRAAPTPTARAPRAAAGAAPRWRRRRSCRRVSSSASEPSSTASAASRPISSGPACCGSFGPFGSLTRVRSLRFALGFSRCDHKRSRISSRNDSRSLRIASSVRVFTVPSGMPVASEISRCDMPR